MIDGVGGRLKNRSLNVQVLVIKIHGQKKFMDKNLEVEKIV